MHIFTQQLLATIAPDLCLFFRVMVKRVLFHQRENKAIEVTLYLPLPLNGSRRQIDTMLLRSRLSPCPPTQHNPFIVLC